VDALLDLFAKGAILIAVLLVLAALCLLVCGIALSPFISVLYLIADWREKKKLKRAFPDTQKALQAENEASLRECSKVHGS